MAQFLHFRPVLSVQAGSVLGVFDVGPIAGEQFLDMRHRRTVVIDGRGREGQRLGRLGYVWRRRRKGATP